MEEPYKQMVRDAVGEVLSQYKQFTSYEDLEKAFNDILDSFSGRCECSVCTSRDHMILEAFVVFEKMAALLPPELEVDVLSVFHQFVSSCVARMQSRGGVGVLVVEKRPDTGEKPN
jgi:hypothetical protein